VAGGEYLEVEPGAGLLERVAHVPARVVLAKREPAAGAEPVVQAAARADRR
jgi:hypothetical protein